MAAKVGDRAPVLERDLQREILAFLERVPGVYVWKAGAGMFRVPGRRQMVRMGKKGVSDIVGWYRQYATCGPAAPVRVAQFLAIEVKRAGAVLTFEQSVFLDRVRDAGGIAIVAHSVQDVKQGLGL